MSDQKDRPYRWFLVSCIAGGLLAFAYLVSGGSGESDPAFNAGYAFVGALVAWLILIAVGLRRAGVARAAGGFVVVWSIAFCGAIIAAHVPRSAVATTSGKLSGQMERIIEESTDPAATGPVKGISLENVQPGQKGQLDVFMARMVNESVAMQNEYFAELEALGWNSILDAERLDRDRKLTQSRLIVQRAHETAARTCAEQGAQLHAASRRVAAELDLSEDVRKELLDGFDRGMVSGAEHRRQICQLDVAIVEAVQMVLEALEGDPGWTLENNMFMFTNDASLAQYNQGMRAVQDLSAHQAHLRRQAMAEGADKMRRAGY